MKANIKVGGRRLRNDRKDTRNWVGDLRIVATDFEFDPYILAALGRALFGGNHVSAECDALRKSILIVADQCKRDHAAVDIPSGEGE